MASEYLYENKFKPLVFDIDQFQFKIIPFTVVPEKLNFKKTKYI